MFHVGSQSLQYFSNLIDFELPLCLKPFVKEILALKAMMGREKTIPFPFLGAICKVSGAMLVGTVWESHRRTGPTPVFPGMMLV